MQCDSDLKEKFAAAGLDTFYQYLLPGYPNLTDLAAKVLRIFGTTYLCEQVFSVMRINKTKLCSSLSQQHSNDIEMNMKLATTQDVMPDIDAHDIVKAERCQVSGTKSTVGNPT